MGNICNKNIEDRKKLSHNKLIKDKPIENFNKSKYSIFINVSTSSLKDELEFEKNNKKQSFIRNTYNSISSIPHPKIIKRQTISKLLSVWNKSTALCLSLGFVCPSILI